MSNNTTTGGYILPDPVNPPLEGQALNRFLQQWIAGVSGLPGELVRVHWQTEPPEIPGAGNAWASFGIRDRAADDYAYFGHDGTLDNGAGADVMQRHTFMTLAGKFYDTGVNGLADSYASQFRDGVLVSQNRWALVQNGFGVVRVGSMVSVPVILNQRWQYRVDLEIVLKREKIRQYPVRTFESSAGDIYTDGGLPPQPF